MCTIPLSRSFAAATCCPAIFEVSGTHLLRPVSAAPFSARLVTSFLLTVPSRACGRRERPHLAADRCDAHSGVKTKRLPPVDMQGAVEHEAKHAWNGHALGFAERANAQFWR